MDQNQLASGPLGRLRADQELHPGFRFKEDIGDRPAGFALRTPPEITGNGCQVGIFEQGFEGLQTPLWLAAK